MFYEHARRFVVEELERHRTNIDVKLAPRYAWLLRYFEAREEGDAAAPDEADLGPAA